MINRSVHDHNNSRSGHAVAYGVGLIHGLAGSGAVVLLAMAEISGMFTEFFYLISFGAGSIVGMLIAAGLFSLPFTKKFANLRKLQLGMTLFSSLLCIGYGSSILIGLM